MDCGKWMMRLQIIGLSPWVTVRIIARYWMVVYGHTHDRLSFTGLSICEIVDCGLLDYQSEDVFSGLVLH